eukprot:4570551-Pyramimonas_sp.AAC.1
MATRPLLMKRSVSPTIPTTSSAVSLVGSRAKQRTSRSARSRSTTHAFGGTPLERRRYEGHLHPR